MYTRSQENSKQKQTDKEQSEHNYNTHVKADTHMCSQAYPYECIHAGWHCGSVQPAGPWEVDTTSVPGPVPLSWRGGEGEGALLPPLLPHLAARRWPGSSGPDQRGRKPETFLFSFDALMMQAQARTSSLCLHFVRWIVNNYGSLVRIWTCIAEKPMMKPSFTHQEREKKRGRTFPTHNINKHNIYATVPLGTPGRV